MVQSREQMNLGAGLGVAVREFATASGPVDYALFVGGILCGVVEAKPEGTTLSGFADQAARYVSLALALGPPPLLEAPERSEQLPGSLLEVLDFAPLVREFYRRSDIDEKLTAYTRAYQAEGDRLRQPTADMVQSVLSYLHTRPITVATERVPVKPPSTKKKNQERLYTTRQHERHFFIVPDLLGVPTPMVSPREIS